MERQTELRVLRARYNLTQEQTADILGVSRATYVNVENGKQRGSVELWQKIQKAFDLSDADTWRMMRDAESEGEQEV